MSENENICTKMETKERDRKIATHDQSKKNSCATKNENQTIVVNAY